MMATRPLLPIRSEIDRRASVRDSLRVLLVVAMIGAVLFVIPPRPANAGATFVVDTTVDSVDAVPGDGVCADALGDCSLRAAVMEANAFAGADDIILTAGTHTLSLHGANEDASATGDLDILESLTITGLGHAGTVVDGDAEDRVFHVVTPSAVVLLDSLRVYNGAPGTSPGANTAGMGILNWGDLTLQEATIVANHGASNGGAIYSSNQLTLVRTSVTNNSAGNGGGISNLVGGTLTVVDSTFSGNSATEVGGAIQSRGGATIQNSTISNNSSVGNGGGLYNVSTGFFTIENSTIVGNSTSGYGGGIYNANSTSGSVSIASSILSDGTAGVWGPNCSGVVTSLGYNLVGDDASCTFEETTGDVWGTPTAPIDPMLGALANNGGLTLTHLPAAASPVVDAGPATCLAADQRGTVRAQGPMCDIGSVELVAPSAVDDPYDAITGVELAVDSASGVLANDSAGETGALAIVAPGAFTTAHGSGALNADGSFTYLSDPTYVGDDTFTYQAANGVHTTNTATVTISVAPLPIANEDSYGLAEDGVLTVGTDPAFDLAWGTSGAGNGQFNAPEAVAVDAAGNVYVVDRDNYRIQKFTSDGAYVTQWGSFGSGDTEFGSPTDVAVDPSGNVYVVDQNNHRIQKFTSDGTYVTKWGSNGTGDGQFAFPYGIAADQAGNIYVADSDNARIQKFDGLGNFLAKWGSSGVDPGQFSSPLGLASDNAGSIYVADYGNNRVQVFTDDGTFVDEWGTAGTVAGEFTHPRDVAIDQFGTAYVADSGNNRIQAFSAYGTYLAQWGATGSADGQFQNPFSVVAGAANQVYVADRDNNRIQRFEPGGVLVNDYDLDGDPLTAVLDTDVAHGSLALNTDGSFTYTPTAGYHGSDSFTYHATDGTNDSNIVTATIAVSSVNDVPTAGDDAYGAAGDQTLTVSVSHTYASTWNSFADPAGVAVDDDGYTYVTNYATHIVQKRAADGAVVDQWGSFGTGEGQFNSPVGIAADGGYVYVTENLNHRVQKFTTDGTFVTSWGASGTGNGQIHQSQRGCRRCCRRRLRRGPRQ